MTLTRDEILSADVLASERVKVPEWGGEVMVRELTGAERDDWESSIVSTDGRNVKVNSANLRAKLVAMSVVDEDGKRMFSDKDASKLGRLSAAALDRVVDVAKRLSRIADGDVEELGNGSGTTRSGDSAST